MKTHKAAQFFSCALTLILLSLTACQTTKISMNDYQPVAILTIYSNRSVPWHVNTETSKTSSSYDVEQTDDGVLTGLLNRALDQNDPETTLAKERINKAAALFTNSIKDAGIESISRENLQSSNSYVTGVKNFLSYMDSKMAADGYEVVSSSSNKLNKMMAKETGAQIMLYVSFRFEKQKVMDGVHEVGAQARVDLTVYGAGQDGKTLINKTYTALSPEYTAYKNNKYDREELCSYFDSTIQNAIDQFIMDLTDPVTKAENQEEEEFITISIPGPIFSED